MKNMLLLLLLLCLFPFSALGLTRVAVIGDDWGLAGYSYLDAALKAGTYGAGCKVYNATSFAFSGATAARLASTVFTSGTTDPAKAVRDSAADVVWLSAGLYDIVNSDFVQRCGSPSFTAADYILLRDNTINNIITVINAVILANPMVRIFIPFYSWLPSSVTYGSSTKVCVPYWHCKPMQCILLDMYSKLNTITASMSNITVSVWDAGLGGSYGNPSTTSNWADCGTPSAAGFQILFAATEAKSFFGNVCGGQAAAPPRKVPTSTDCDATQPTAMFSPLSSAANALYNRQQSYWMMTVFSLLLIPLLLSI